LGSGAISLPKQGEIGLKSPDFFGSRGSYLAF